MPRLGIGLGVCVMRSASAGFVAPANCEMWLRADGATAGATLTVTDRSGNGRDATQSSAGAQPTIRADGHARDIGGKGVLDFDGSDDFLNLVTVSMSKGEIFAVLRGDFDGGTPNGLWNLGTDTAASWVPYSDGTIYEAFGTGVRKNTGNPTASLTSAFLYNVISMNGEFTVNINGTQHYTTSTNTSAFPGSNWQLGKGLQTSIFKGVIGDFLLFSRKLTTQERTDVKTYIAQYWSLTLS